MSGVAFSQGPSAERQPRLYLRHLDDAVSRLFSAGIATSTARTYRSGQSRFFEFCRRAGTSSGVLSEETLCRFVAYLAQDHLAYGTIKCYLSAVRHLQIAQGFGDIFASRLPRLDYVLRGVRRSQGSQPKRPRLPMTPEILRTLHRHWSPREDDFDVVMLWAACCLGFFGFLRAGEFTVESLRCFDPVAHLAPADVSVDSREVPKVVSVRIKQSKTDPFRRGTVIHLGRTGNSLCPVAAILAYMARRVSEQGPLFILRDGSTLSRRHLVSEVRSALSACGLDCKMYAGHSFRIGAATTAAAKGVEDSTIRSLGRWRSDVYQLYIRVDSTALAQVTHTLAN